MCGGYAADDGVALHFRGTGLERAVSSRLDGSAYEVRPRGRSVAEKRLEVSYLGTPPVDTRASQHRNGGASTLPSRVRREPVAA
jgi:hypothetical protein